MSRRSVKMYIGIGLGALILAASVAVTSAAPGGNGRCNSRKEQCTTTTTQPLPPPTTSTVSTTTTSGGIAPDTQGTWVSPEGVTINVATSGTWTISDIYRMLLENATNTGDLSRIGPTLSIRVQDTYASSTSTAAVGLPGGYTSVESIIWLKGVGSTFSMKPDKQFAHEYGHAWTMFHHYLGDGGDWTPYLTARGLAGDPRLDSSYGWSPGEIIAEDYRLFFGSPASISQSPNHMNSDIAEPSDVSGLRDYLLGAFQTL